MQGVLVFSSLQPSRCTICISVTVECNSSVDMQIAQEADATQQLFDALKSSKFVQSLKVTPRDLQWALNCVYSRSFAVPRPFGELHLLPIAPHFSLILCGHNNAVNVIQTMYGQRINTRWPEHQ